MTGATQRRRLSIGALAGVMFALLGGGVAHADAPAPTDYQTEIVAIEPAADGISFDVIGGDSFVELTVERGVEVVVAGYEGEPYLWFREDGTVAENQRSPATYLNATRYGTEFPASASAEAEPEWSDVAADGSYAWYDHRAHWMLDIHPAGRSPGDRILEAVIPLRVGGGDVDVTVISTWQTGSSAWPLTLGLIGGLATAGVAVWLARRQRSWPLAVLPVASLAALVGWWQYLPLPAEADPQLVWPLLPTLALLAAGTAAIVWRWQRLVASAVTLLAGLLLVAWGVLKRDDIEAAIVPTTAPQWLDVATVVASLVAGVGVAGMAVVGATLRAAGTERARATT